MAADFSHRTLRTERGFGAVVDRSAARHAVRTAQAAGHRPAVIHIDIDRMHRLNAQFGQQAGDRLLDVIGGRLTGALEAAALAGGTAGSGAGSGAMVTAQGGAFLVVLEDSSADQARSVANLLCSVVAAPYVVDGPPVSITSCVGVACDDVPGLGVDLIERAFLACRRAKAIGPGNLVAYDDSVEVEAERRRRRAGELRSAIADGQLRLVVQPEVDLRDGQVEGVEALVRWMHPVDGLLAPANFLPDVEALGLMNELGAWVLDESIALATRWRRVRHGAPIRVWVNLAAQQLAEGERFLQQVTRALEADQIAPQSIGFEVTESSLLEDLPSAVGTLSALRALGIEIALDDFGTGYSSLTYLRQLPVTAVKIDRQFVSGIGGSLADEAIVEAVIDLSHALGLRVVAEGIEDIAHVDALVRLGADHAQGYYFGMPVPAGELEPWLNVPWCGAAAPGSQVASIDRRADELPGFGSPRSRLLLSAFDNAHDAVVVTAAHGGLDAPIVYVNAAFELESGFAAIDVVGRTVDVLLTNPPDPDVLLWFESVYKDRRGATIEMAKPRADGSVYQCETTLSPIIDERGVHTHWMHVQRDLTQRRAAEGDRARFQGLIEQTTSLVYLADTDGVLLYMNAALRHVVGIGVDESLEGLDSLAIFLPHQKERIAREVVPSLTESGRWSGEALLVNRVTGATTEVVSDVQLVEDPLRPGSRLVAFVSRDVSDIRALERADSRRRQLGTFAALVASEALDTGVAQFFENVNGMLAQFGALLHVDRVYVDRIDMGTQLIEPLGGWRSERFPEGAEAPPLALDRVPLWIARLEEGGLIVDVPSLGPTAWADELAAVYPHNPPTAHLSVSLRIGGELVGVLGVAHLEVARIWSADEVAAVQAVGDILTNLLARQRSEAALQTSEARLSALLASVGELLFVIDARGAIRYLNARAVDVLAVSPSEVIGRPFTDIVDPADRAATAEAFLATTQGVGPPSFEVRLVCRGEHSIWFDVETQGVFDPVVGGYTVSFRDVSLRHEMERLEDRQAAFDAEVTKISRWALAVESEDILAQLDEHLESIGRILGADSVYVTLFENDGFRTVARWAADGSGPDLHNGRADARSVSALIDRSRTCTTLVVDDINDHDGAWVDEWMQFAVPDRAGVNVPLVEGGRCFGNVGAAMVARPRHWSADEIALIERISETLSTLLAREQAEASLRKSEKRLAALLDGSHDLVVVVDPEGIVTYANGSVQASLGYPPEDVVGRSMVDFVFPDDVEQAVARLGMLHVGIETPTTTLRLVAADGTVGWWEITSGAERVPLDGGRVLTCRDVTDRLAREADAARWVDMLRHAFDVAQRALDLDPVDFIADLPAVCARIATILDVDFVYVDRLEETSGHLVKVAGYSSPTTATGLRPGEYVELHDLPLWVERLRDARPIVVRDASRCDEPWAEEKRRVIGPEGGVMVMPLSSGGELLGVVGASMVSTPRDWTEDELTFLRIVAETIAHVLERERLDVALRASEARFRLLSETAADMVILLDLDGRVTYVSPSSRRLLGFTPEQLIGSFARAFIHPADRRDAYRNAATVLEQGWMMSDMRLRRADGSYVWVTNSASVVKDPATGEPVEFRASIRDVSDRKRLEDELEQQALHDPLTGLGNRVLLKNRIEHVLARAGSPRVSLLCLDLDGFKDVNDTHGHAGGDVVLRHVADRLRTICRPTDTLARTGGDEFVILCPDADEQAALRIADRIVFVMGAPIETSTFTVKLGASVGVVSGAGRGMNADWLLLEADHAMYAAKRAGKGRVALARVPVA